FAFEVGLGRKDDEERHGAEQEVEEEAEGVRKNQAGKARAVIPGGDDRECSAADGSDEGEEREKVAVLENRLEQHDENAERAPDEFRQNEMNISEGGQAVIHLAGAGPFGRSVFLSLVRSKLRIASRVGWTRAGKSAYATKRDFGG